MAFCVCLTLKANHCIRSERIFNIRSDQIRQCLDGNIGHWLKTYFQVWCLANAPEELSASWPVLCCVYFGLCVWIDSCPTIQFECGTTRSAMTSAPKTNLPFLNMADIGWGNGAVTYNHWSKNKISAYNTWFHWLSDVRIGWDIDLDLDLLHAGPHPYQTCSVWLWLWHESNSAYSPYLHWHLQHGNLLTYTSYSNTNRH